MKALGALTLALCALAVSGCGGGSKPAAASGGPRCTNSATPRALARVHRDIAAIRRAALTVSPKDTFNGNKAVNDATDRFLLDVQKAPVSNLQRNRLYDYAMSALLSACDQCFQALEADRPVVTIRFRHADCH